MRATFKIILFSRPNKDGNYPVKLRATWLRQTKDYTLHRVCLPDQWDATACRFRKSYPGWNKENDILRTYEQRAADVLRDFEREGVRFTFESFEARVFTDRAKTGQLVWRWMLQCSESMAESGQYGNSLFYKNVGAVVKAYAPSALLQDVDGEWLQKFERWMRKHRKVNDGGISINMRTLRAAGNKAIKSKLMPKTWQPFEDYSFSHLKKTKSKRAITLEEIWLLRDADCYTEGERFALDLFMFSFYTRGMNLADIAELRAAKVRDLRVVYERKKTHKAYSIRLHAKAAAILDRYKGGSYLFPIYADGVHDTEVQKYNRLHKIMKAVNNALKGIAGRVGVGGEDFSFYVSRHSYGMALKTKGVNRDIISEALGHSDVRTTDHYLKDFDNSVLDGADELLF
jgi:integrase